MTRRDTPLEVVADPRVRLDRGKDRPRFSPDTRLGKKALPAVFDGTAACHVPWLTSICLREKLKAAGVDRADAWMKRGDREAMSCGLQLIAKSAECGCLSPGTAHAVTGAAAHCSRPQLDAFGNHDSSLHLPVPGSRLGTDLGEADMRDLRDTCAQSLSVWKCQSTSKLSSSLLGTRGLDWAVRLLGSAAMSAFCLIPLVSSSSSSSGDWLRGGPRQMLCVPSRFRVQG